MSYMLFEDGASGGSYYSSSATNAYYFNAAIGAWDVSSVTDMLGILYAAQQFDQTISAWETSQVTTMRNMFKDAYKFNSAIEAWDVSKVKTMARMFYNANEFNSAIGAWDTSNVKDMSNMFYHADGFNDPTIVAWDVSSVTNFAHMFYGAVAFNVDVSPWDIDKTEQAENGSGFDYMFYYARTFNQVLCWDTSAFDTYFMFKNSEGSTDSSAEKCACAAGEYYDGSACKACASGTISFGKTESCVSCTSTLCAPTPAPTVSFLPTNTMTPTIEKTLVSDDTFNDAMLAWLSDEESAEKVYGHISGK
jgi:hypothetical protein